MDFRKVATVALAHLDRIAEPYNAFDMVRMCVCVCVCVCGGNTVLTSHVHQIPEVSDSLPVRGLHWGAVEETAGSSISDLLVELKTKQVVAAEKFYLVLTTEGKVFCTETPKATSGDFTLTVRQKSKVKSI